MDFKVVIAQVTFHAELVDWRGVIVPNFRLLCIVSDTHTYVNSTTTAPDVVRQLKTEIHENISFILKSFKR